MHDATLLAAASAPEAPQGLSLRGLIEVFYAPVKLFTALVKHPRVLTPYLVYGVLLVLVMVLMSDMILDMQMKSPRFQEQMQAQGQVVTPQVKTFMKMSTIITGSIGYLLVPLIAAGLALFVGNFIFAGQVRYKAVLSVILYGEIIWVVGSLVVAAISFSKGELASPFSLSFLAPEAEFQSPLFALLHKIELFQVWEWIVSGIGLSVLYQVSRARGFIMVMLSLGLLTALYVLSTAIMS